MLIKKFEDQARQRPDKIAVNTGKEVLSYDELNRYANRIAGIITARCREIPGNNPVGLLFDHGLDMIAAVLGTLKAGKIYVPLSPGYPLKRLAYMLTHSGASLLVTRENCGKLARKLALENDIAFQELHPEEIRELPGENPRRDADEKTPAYIMYTSGSTGRPKGVVQNHGNVLYYTRNWIQRFSITAAARMTLFSSFCHDGSIQDMFSALLEGATLYPYSIKAENRENSGSFVEIAQLLKKEQITLWHSVPSLFNAFVDFIAGRETFPHLEYILLGGERLREYEIRQVKRFFPHTFLANVYGQTESSVSSIALISPGNHDDASITIGTPLDETGMFIVSPEGDELEPLEIGEILVSSAYLSPGYWQDEEATANVFSHPPGNGRVYWTGDLGRLLLDGRIEFLGRKDAQIKIRGYRIEPAEIESRLLELQAIKEAVVTAVEIEGEPENGKGEGEKYLCAYWVPADTGTGNPGNIDITELRDHLAGELPDYMIPRYFLQLQKMPCTPGGKVDKKALPRPGNTTLGTGNYTPPREETETTLARIWSDLLKIDKELIGIDANFFALGGYSLKAASLLSVIHKELQVKIPMERMFNQPTIRGLSRYIREAGKETHLSLQAVEKKEYYRSSAAQKRLYFAHQVNLSGSMYNITAILTLEGHLEKQQLTRTFQRLIKRHASLRTSFEIIAREVVQRIHDQVKFAIRWDDSTNGDPYAFVRPFDLAEAPLLRVGVITAAKPDNSGNTSRLMIDIHHIVCDGISLGKLIDDFTGLYRGEALAPLRTRYIDFSRWEHLTLQEKKINLAAQEKYWLDRFAVEIPQLNLPTDFPRPDRQSFAGEKISFTLGRKKVEELKTIATREKTTLFVVLLSVFNGFLYKLGGQEDIVIGTPFAGRKHVDLEPLVGMFVQMLPLRNFPQGDKTFNTLVKEVQVNTLQVLANQDYSFEKLVDQVARGRDYRRGPLFDVAFALQNLEFPEFTLPGITLKKIEYMDEYSRFDLVLRAREEKEELIFTLNYCTTLFQKDTIEMFIENFKEVVAAVLEDNHIQLKQIPVSHGLMAAKAPLLREQFAF